MSENHTASLRVVVDPSGAISGSRQAQGAIGGLSQSATDLRRVLASLGAYLGARELVQYADSWRLIDSRIRLAARSTADAGIIQERLFDIAQRTRTEFESTATVYTRIARNADELGRTQGELLDFTESLSKAIVTSGATAQEASAGLIQLSQALASGRLSGDEFRSVSEQLPAVLQTIQAATGMTAAELRKMANDQELTADIVISSILKMRETIDRDFASMPMTISQGWTIVTNAMHRFVGQGDSTIGASEQIASALSYLGLTVIPALGKGFNSFLGGWELMAVDAAVAWQKFVGWMERDTARFLEATAAAFSALPGFRQLVAPLLEQAAEYRQRVVGLSEALETWRAAEYERITATRAATSATLSDDGAILKRTQSLASESDAVKEAAKSIATLGEAVAMGLGKDDAIGKLIAAEQTLRKQAMDANRPYADRIVLLKAANEAVRDLATHWERANAAAVFRNGNGGIAWSDNINVGMQQTIGGPTAVAPHGVGAGLTSRGTPQPGRVEQFGQGLKDGISGILKSFGPLAVAAAALKPVFDGLRESLGPVITALAEPLRAIGQLVGSVIVPVLSLLEPPLKLLAIAASYVVEAFGWMVRGIGRLLDKIPGVSAKGIRTAGQEMMDGARAARESLYDVAEANKNVAEAARGVTSALNAPDGLRLSLYRYRATALSMDTGRPYAPPPSGPPAPPPGGPRYDDGPRDKPRHEIRGDTTVTVNVTQLPGESGADLARRVVEAIESEALLGGGNPVTRISDR